MSSVLSRVTRTRAGWLLVGIALVGGPLAATPGLGDDPAPNAPAKEAAKDSAEDVKNDAPNEAASDTPNDATADAEEAAARRERETRRRQVVERVNQLMRERWQRDGVTPAPRTTDAEFLRRASLDLIGVIPRVSEVREFLATEPADGANIASANTANANTANANTAKDGAKTAAEHPDKRDALIDRLLDSPRHSTHLANQWRQVLLPGGITPEQLGNVAGVQSWLRARFAENLRYDRLVADFLVVTGSGDTGPALFYTALELKPEKLASATARIFLGLQIECAQCHHHPFDKWRQEEFWGYAAFFARVREPRDRMGPGLTIEDQATGEVTLPGTSQVVAPVFPDGRRPQAEELGTRREQLAIWMASRDNPYLARSAVNRAWAQLMGRGIVEPVDDLGAHNPPSHPEVLDTLTAYFVETGFDLRELLRTLARLEVYQLSSRGAPDASPPSESFARMAAKPLTADQLFDSIERLRLAARPNVAGDFSGSPLQDPRRQAFLAQFPAPGRSATEYQAGVLQALTLLNGDNTAELTRAEQGGVLGAALAPVFSNEQRVEILFLATVGRPPAADEKQLFLEHLQASGPPQQALSDVLWTLVNTAEFLFCN